MEQHKGPLGIFAVAIRQTKPNVNLWSFGSDWKIIYSNYIQKKVVSSVELLPKLGYPFRVSLSPICKAIFQENYLIIATLCGHLLVYDCLVDVFKARKRTLLALLRCTKMPSRP